MVDSVSSPHGEPARLEGDQSTRSCASNPPSEKDPSAGPGTYLSGLSELAGRSFASNREAVEAILQLITEQLGLRSSFLTRITREAGRKEVLTAYNSAGGSDVQEGVLLELPQTF